MTNDITFDDDKHLLCSLCFNDFGLRHNADKIGIKDDSKCSNCKSKNGKKLRKSELLKLTHEYFVRGTTIKLDYGEAPALQFNQHQYGNNTPISSGNLSQDISLIENTAKIGLFHYGPRLWMVGEIEPLKELQNNSTRSGVITKIIDIFPDYVINESHHFFRIRKNPIQPLEHHEYDSPPDEHLETYRLDSKSLPVLYGSPDIECCIHECRSTIEDSIYIARMSPSKELRMLNLNAVIKEDTTEFESLDISVQFVFAAGAHSYEISRDIALATYAAGYDGVIYPSYFSPMQTGTPTIETYMGISTRLLMARQGLTHPRTIPNVCIFGRPVAGGTVSVRSIHRLVLKSAKYDFSFGPAEF